MIIENSINEFDKKYIFKEKDEEVCFVETHQMYEVLDLTDVFTKEVYRRKGYARKLINYIIQNTNAKKIMLEVNVENISAVNLYKSLGFKIISERKNYYKDKTALIMELIK